MISASIIIHLITVIKYPELFIKNADGKDKQFIIRINRFHDFDIGKSDHPIKILIETFDFTSELI